MNWKRLTATHRELGGEGELIVQLLPDVATTADVLDQALVDDPCPDGEGPAKDGWIPGPKGWLLLLETDVDQALWDWTGLLGRTAHQPRCQRGSHRRSAGWTRSWAMDIESSPRLNALLAYQAYPSETTYGPARGADPAILDSVLAHTMSWVLAGADLAPEKPTTSGSRPGPSA